MAYLHRTLPSTKIIFLFLSDKNSGCNGNLYFPWTYNRKSVIGKWRVLDKLNSFHETIKFTKNYSKTNAVFLDVKIEKSIEGNLCTSVFEKDTNVHQYIEFSSCHPLSCKKGIPFGQAKRYRRITSDNDSFKRDLNSLFPET